MKILCNAQARIAILKTVAAIIAGPGREVQIGALPARNLRGDSLRKYRACREIPASPSAGFDAPWPNKPPGDAGISNPISLVDFNSVNSGHGIVAVAKRVLSTPWLATYVC